MFDQVGHFRSLLLVPASYEQKKCRIEIPKSLQTFTKEYASFQPALVGLTALWRFILPLFQVIPGRCWETKTQVGAMGKVRSGLSVALEL